MQNSYRLDLQDLADWLYLPMVELCRYGNIEEPSGEALLDLAELLFDFDLNSRLRWTNHNSRYRRDDFNRMLPSRFFHDEELVAGLDNLKILVSDYVDVRLRGFLGRLVDNNHVYESIRVGGWLWLVDLGKVTPARRRVRMTEEEYAATVNPTESRLRVVNRGGVRTLTMAPKSRGAVPMNTINIHITHRPTYQHHCDEDLTDEQYEWLAEVDQRRRELARRQPCTQKTAATLRSGMRFQEKVRRTRSQLGRVRSYPNDLYVNAYRDGFTVVPTHELDVGAVHHPDPHRTCPLRPIRRKRRQGRTLTRRKPSNGY